MIDIIKAKKEFEKYISNYDCNNSKISLKIEHIERVVNNCRKIAKDLNLSDEEIKLAELIGLFHDLGRFEQIRIANTFSDRDSGINHAEYGIKILFEDKLIKNFIEDSQYDGIIKAAVLNHNKANIEDGLSEQELLFSKIIRDADKLDIFYEMNVAHLPSLFWYENFDQTEINPLVISQFENYQIIDYKDIHTNADHILTFFAFVFDLYFNNSLKTVAENKYLESFGVRLKEYFKNENIHKQIDYALDIIHEYYKINNV